MAPNVPPAVELAFQKLVEGLKKVGTTQDPLRAPWAELEPGVARLLGGPLQLDKVEHQEVALGASALLGKRLAEQEGAFWAMNREAPDGWVLGFPDAVIMLSPFGAVVEALARAELSRLDELAKEVRAALARAKLSPDAAPERLVSADYERLFDPAYVQWAVLDAARLKQAWEEPVAGLLREVRSGLERAGAKLPAQLRQQVEAQLVGSLAALDQGKSLIAQLGGAGRLVELSAHLSATVESTRPAPEEFWAGAVLPLLFIGAPQSFPPLDDEEKEAARQGVDPLFLYLDMVPYQHPAHEEGLLGAFGEEDVSVPHPALEHLAPPRLLEVRLEQLAPALEKLDPAAAKAAFERFVAHLSQATGQPLAPGQGHQVLEEAFGLLAELRRLWEARGRGKIVLRRLPEAEAAADAALSVVRQAMHGPRIILA